MKLKFKRVLSSMLSLVIGMSAVPTTSIHSEEIAEIYPYMMFAGSDIEGAITINTDTVCINGNIATNGTIISTTNNFNINGTSTEHAEEEMIYFFKKLDYTYFNTENVEAYVMDYYLEEQNININNPLIAEGDVELVGNININSGVKALDDITLNGNVENSNDSIICSQTGDIIINTDNVNLNGIIYAPEGTISINAQNLNINGVIMIADTINITCPNLNANYNTTMAEFIGTESEVELDVVAYANYLTESNTVNINWYTTVPKGVFEIQFSDDNETYSTIDTVSNIDSYQYAITEDFHKKYIRIVETTYYGEVFTTTAFIVERTDNGYEILLLDSDEDGLPDILEEVIGTDIYVIDTDQDGLTDYQEYYITNTNPSVYDSVIQGVSDADADCDNDGLSNIYEITIGTDPLSIDTDIDELSDYDEIYVYNTAPLVADSDNDGLEDGVEIKLGLDPNNPETFGTPDAEYTVEQTISADNPILSFVNTEDNPYELSIDIKTNRDIEKELFINESPYSFATKSDKVIGKSISISVSDLCNPEDIILKYTIKDEYLNNYSSINDFNGIEQFFIFKFYEEVNMLLPIKTKFDVENNCIYAEIEELGNYCIMDMGVWLNSFKSETNISNENSIIELYSYENDISEEYSNEDSHLDFSYKADTTNTPIDLVFMLQTAGNLKDAFNKEKDLIIDFCTYVFDSYSNVNAYVITFDKSSGSILNSSNGVYYFEDIVEIESALNKIIYTDDVYDYCDRGQAFKLLSENIKFRENSDIFIYYMLNGATVSRIDYDNEQVISKVKNNLLTAYSEIGYPGWHYEYNSDQIRISEAIKNNGDLFLSISNNTLSSLEEHFEGKVSPERYVYKITGQTGLEEINLDGELSPNNNIDTDGDNLTDWDEVNKEYLKHNDDGSTTLPTFIEFYKVVTNDYDFNIIADTPQYYNYLSTENEFVSILPILSNPALIDSDGDGLNDNKDPEPLINYHDKYYDDYIITPTYTDNYTNNIIDNLEKKANESYNSHFILNATSVKDYYNILYIKSIINANLGGFLEANNAKQFYLHFLSNTGTEYKFDASEVIEQTIDGQTIYNKNILDIMDFCESTVTDNLNFITNPAVNFDGTKFTTHAAEVINRNKLEIDWWYSLGDSCASMSISCSKNGNEYTALVTYNIIDYYDFKPWSLAIAGIVVDGEMHELHKAGRAREYRVTGTYERKISWTEGTKNYEICE